MPIFGYNVIGANNAPLPDTTLFGNFDLARILTLGNPVPGGNMVTAHVYMRGALIGPPALTVQIGVYDATGGVPAVYPLIAASVPFVIPAGAPLAQWWVTPIVGALTPGGSYCAGVLANNAHAGDGNVYYDPIPNENVHKVFIVPGVLPNPLGVPGLNPRLWSLYITYVLPSDDDVSQQVAAWSCDCSNDS